MLNISVTKDIGSTTAGCVLSEKVKKDYGANGFGASWRAGNAGDEIIAHLADGQSTTVADALLAAIALPTCSFNLLDITVDVGTLIVADVTSIVADGSEVKTIKATIAMDDSTGDLEVVVYEKVGSEEYSGTPAGKSHICDLKEYTLAAAGAALVEAVNFIS